MCCTASLFILLNPSILILPKPPCMPSIIPVMSDYNMTGNRSSDQCKGDVGQLLRADSRFAPSQ